MKTLPIALMSLLLGIAGTLVVTSMRMSSGHDSMTMAQMVDDLKGKSGDDLDKAFIEGMIVHHQGAIDMAKQVQTSAKHEEVRKLADDIVKAQTGEISQMRDWKKQWSY